MKTQFLKHSYIYVEAFGQLLLPGLTPHHTKLKEEGCLASQTSPIPLLSASTMSNLTQTKVCGVSILSANFAAKVHKVSVAM